MGHIPHLVHWLFEETKIGGWVAAAGAIIGGVLVWSSSPFIIDSPFCARQLIPSACTKVFEPEALAWCLGGGVIGGAVGVAIALLLVELGVDKDKLGITKE